jgi:hypothetical protein
MEHAYLLNASATVLLVAPVTVAAALAALATTLVGAMLRPTTKPLAWTAQL